MLSSCIMSMTASMVYWSYSSSEQPYVAMIYHSNISSEEGSRIIYDQKHLAVLCRAYLDVQGTQGNLETSVYQACVLIYKWFSLSENYSFTWGSSPLQFRLVFLSKKIVVIKGDMPWKILSKDTPKIIFIPFSFLGRSTSFKMNYYL